MVARHFGDDFDLARVEAVEVGGGDEVVAVLVVAFEVDRVTDVVQQGGELEPFALACAEIVHRGGEVEEADREALHLLGMGEHPGCPAREVMDLAAADLAGDGDFGRRRAERLEHEALAQRPVAEVEAVDPGARRELLEQHRSGEDRARARRADRRQRGDLLHGQGLRGPRRRRRGRAA